MLTLIVAAALPLLVQQPVQSPNPAQPVPVLAARAFAQLFTTQPPPAPGPTSLPEALKERVRKQVVCGMTLLIVDGRADPKMVVAPKGGRDVDPGMPRVPKPMCGPERK
jgi:hypothetical protein